MDLSPPGSVIVIASLHLMASDVPLRWLDVRTLVPPDNIGARIAGSQGNQLVLLP